MKETFLDLILRTSSSQLDNNGDADYDIVRITPGLAQHKDYCVAMEGQSMIVYDDRITWEAHLKNTGIIITTYSVSLELLRGLAIPVDD